MSAEQPFLSAGRKTGHIDVHLSYRIVALFSEGLYTSPNKAVEELVANSFDAGAERVHVLISPGIEADPRNSSIVVIDDGSGMGTDDLKQHWRIGTSNKRDPAAQRHGRLQIGKFGIGKLATYVLASKLTHVSKRGGKYFATSIDYDKIKRSNGSEVVPSRPIRIPLRELTTAEARQAVGEWTQTSEFKKSGMVLFGKNSPASWTVSIMSDLKDKAGEIRPGRLRWILSTALPLRPDFNVWLNGEKVKSSKTGRGMIRKWVLGKDLSDLPRGAPEGTAKYYDRRQADPELRHGLDVPGAGRVTGYVEAYQDALQGSSDKYGRSCGFFVYVRGRLINSDDGHFGISANELRHGTFSRFRAVVNMDYLDDGLRSTRETVEEGPALQVSHRLLRAIFNHVRNEMETHDKEEDHASNLARRLTAGRASLSSKPIASLARSAAEENAKARHIEVPAHESADKREEFLSDLEEKMRKPEEFVTEITMDSDGVPSDPIARFDTESMALKLNAYHPFVATFRDEFVNKKHRQPLELLAMGEVLIEAQMHYAGTEPSKIERVLDDRDQLLRSLARESGHRSPFSVANDLRNASDPEEMEECVCNAFQSLGFDVTRLGKKGKPDGVATAVLPAGDNRDPQIYKVSLEAKSKQRKTAKVSARGVSAGTIARHCREQKCDHAVVVGPGFATSKDKSALEKEIRSAAKGNAEEKPITITLINKNDLAKLTELRPFKRVGLREIRELFAQNTLPEESARWIRTVETRRVEIPPFRKIVDAMKALAKKFPNEQIKYASLRTELRALEPPVEYQTDNELKDVCKAMMEMSQGAVWADNYKVVLDQSTENALAAIERAMQEHDEAGTEVQNG